MTTLRSFTELEAWQKSRVVRKAISRLAKQFPAEEKFRLTDQIIRSSRGACAAIAEGYGRYHGRDNARFGRIAKGSLTETMDHLTVAYDEEFISRYVLKSHWAMVEEALHVLNGYINYLLRMDSSDSRASDPQEAYGAEDDIYSGQSDDL